MSSLLDRLKVKNIPEKKTEYKILIPRKARTSLPSKQKKDPNIDDMDRSDNVFKPKEKLESDKKDNKVAIVDMTDNDMDFSNFFRQAKGLIFVDEKPKNVDEKNDFDTEEQTMVDFDELLGRDDDKKKEAEKNFKLFH